MHDAPDEQRLPKMVGLPPLAPALPFFAEDCLRAVDRVQDHFRMAAFAVRPQRLEAFQRRLAEIVRGYVIDPDLLARMGDLGGAAALRSRVPTRRSVRTGDLGEMLATEYVRVALGAVAVQRLREKPNVNMPMHGIDCIGVRLVDGRPQFFKGEAKMRGYLRKDVLDEARATVEADLGRIPADELVLLAERHRRIGNDGICDAIATELATVGSSPAAHVVFVGYGRAAADSIDLFLADLSSDHRTHVATIQIDEFQAFIDTVYDLVAET